MDEKPLFSILHTSARPDAWRNVYEQWMQMCEHQERVEYVLCIDPRWGFSLDPAVYDSSLNNIRVVVNNARRCYVDGVNLAARAATGSIFIVNADDQFATWAWDTELSSITVAHIMSPLLSEFVIEVSTGTPEEHLRGIMVMPILSRARYEAQGSVVFFPEYESMFADNDFCAWAWQDSVVVRAHHLMFPHRHWLTNERPQDAVDAAQTRREAWDLGRPIFERRKASGFTAPSKRRTVALCLSGDDFRGRWVDGILDLYAHLIERDFGILRVRNYTSNVYVTREGLRRVVMAHECKPDFLLWLDDDNICSPAHFDKLLAGLDANLDVDGVAGWCWIHDQNKTGFMPSCGLWSPDHLHWDPFPPQFRHGRVLHSFEVGGLPCMLMRYSALEKAGEGCFLPILDNRLELGITGEDIAFFRSAEQGGAKFLVDPQVRVPHLKYVEVEPVFPAEGRVPVKVACMMRVKNESRWIARAIESVKPLCGAHVYVYDDGSTDNTREIAQSSGARVWRSPFDYALSEGLDERRDKEWLLRQVKSQGHFDWILCIDGDEELEPGGCEKIRRALETNPPVDIFALRILNLWNSVDSVRMDGVYGVMKRASLFRTSITAPFESYAVIQNEGHHEGLHCSNAPGLGSIAAHPLNVFLLHYGALHCIDRVRKYEWITRLDPRNESEDFYQHMVQGDFASIPADAKLKYAGPLDIRKLPRHLIPKFEGDVPGPLVESFAAS